MAYQVLARKYRPQRFADVVGQDHVTVTLMNALAQDRIAHGYIFSGHRGIGKTTIARILACALNCRNAIGSTVRPTPEPCEVCESCTEIRAGNSVDVIEIDAATNRGIDEIRELRDASRYRPARDRFKIYILDEAHQITDAAFNALLKTLEEPPDHMIFMMATTQPEDIPQTVRSRCQHFSFHAVKLADILGELRGIATREGVDADDGALGLLAEAGDGSMRDALSIMDQAIASAPVVDGRARLDQGQIRELMGTVPNAVFERVLQAVAANRSAEVMTIANELLSAGNSPAQLARQAVRYLRSCLMAKITGATVEEPGAVSELLQVSPEEIKRAAGTAALFSEEELARYLQVMLRTFDELGYRQEQRFHFELGLLKLVHLRRLLPVEELLSGMGVARPASQPGLPVPAVAAPLILAKPAFSPFEADRSRRYGADPVPVRTADSSAALRNDKQGVGERGGEAGYGPVHRGTIGGAPGAVAEPEKAGPTLAAQDGGEEATADSSAALRNDKQKEVAAPVAVVSAASLPPIAAVGAKDAAVAALREAKQGAAADALEDAAWALEGGEARVQTELSPTMLPVVVNAEAEKIVQVTLRAAGVPRLTLLAGAATSGAVVKKQRVAKSGSAQAKALEHPMVQQAQRLFEAEVQTVIDLSGKE